MSKYIYIVNDNLFFTCLLHKNSSSLTLSISSLSQPLQYSSFSAETLTPWRLCFAISPLISFIPAPFNSSLQPPGQIFIPKGIYHLPCLDYEIIHLTRQSIHLQVHLLYYSLNDLLYHVQPYQMVIHTALLCCPNASSYVIFFFGLIPQLFWDSACLYLCLVQGFLQFTMPRNRPYDVHTYHIVP